MAKEKTFKGVCHFFFETGTEGAYWAFQDSKHIKKINAKTAKTFSCTKCYCALYKNDSVSNISITRIYPGHVAFAPNFKEPKLCRADQHDFKPISEEEWSYDGLHILKNGDRLKIYDKEHPGKIVWEGAVSLTERTSFDENVKGLRIHSTPNNIDKEKWGVYFFKEYPTELIPNSINKK